MAAADHAPGARRKRPRCLGATKGDGTWDYNTAAMFDRVLDILAQVYEQLPRTETNDKVLRAIGQDIDAARYALGTVEVSHE